MSTCCHCSLTLQPAALPTLHFWRQHFWRQHFWRQHQCIDNPSASPARSACLLLTWTSVPSLPCYLHTDALAMLQPHLPLLPCLPLFMQSQRCVCSSSPGATSAWRVHFWAMHCASHKPPHKPTPEWLLRWGVASAVGRSSFSERNKDTGKRRKKEKLKRE